MEALENICACLPGDVARAVQRRADGLTELRLRPGGRPQLCFAQGDELLKDPLAPEEFRKIAARMLEHSLYAWEDELRQGFFTLPGGSRVGVCGRYAVEDGRIGALAYLSALCVRVAREVRSLGVYSEIHPHDITLAELKALPNVKGIILNGGPNRVVDGVEIDVAREIYDCDIPALLLSRPGMGKTTLLRDAARALSEAGRTVALADERGELAACRAGMPTLDVGERTDVMDMCPKRLAIAHMVRALKPDVVVTDEVGDREDAAAVLDARRCGTAVLASAHAASVEDAARRPALREMLSMGAFDLVARIDGGLGRIAALEAWEGSA